MDTGSVLSRWARLGVIGVVAAAAVPTAGIAGETYGQPRPVQAADWGKVQGPVVSLDFPGGTLREYVGAVQRAAGKDTVNVLLPAEAADLPLPPISMKDVSARTALEAVQWAFPQMGPHRVDVTPFGSPESGSPTFAVAYMAMGDRGPVPPSQPARPRDVEVFSIRELIEPAEGGDGVPVETLLTSIEAALSLKDVGVAPDLKFHEDSGLLIVRGTGEQIGTVKSLLREIRGDVQQRRGIARERQRREAEERFHEKKLDIEIDLQEKEVRAAKDRVALVRKLEEQGQVGAHELREAKLDEARQEARMRMLMVERERPSVGRSGRGADAGAGDAGDLAQIIQMLQARVAALEAELAKSKDGQRKPQ